MSEPLDKQSDAELIARVRAGETDCFAELVGRYQAALARVACSRLGRTDWAEDVVQETFLAAFESCASYDPRFGFRTWLWTILLNKCHAHYRRRMRSVPVESWSAECEPVLTASEHDAASPLAALLAKERTAQLEAILARLSLVQADALRLRFFGGLKFHEIAETMRCSPNTAKNRVRWGLTRMAELLQGAGADAPRRSAADQEQNEP